MSCTNSLFLNGNASASDIYDTNGYFFNSSPDLIHGVNGNIVADPLFLDPENEYYSFYMGV